MKSFQRKWEGLEITIITVIVLLLLLLAYLNWAVAILALIIVDVYKRQLLHLLSVPDSPEWSGDILIVVHITIYFLCNSCNYHV